MAASLLLVPRESGKFHLQIKDCNLRGLNVQGSRIVHSTWNEIDLPIGFRYNSNMPVAVLTIHLQLPYCSSLKDKRSRIKPILNRLHKEFNVSTAEIDLQDRWRETVLACGMIGNDRVLLNNALQDVTAYISRMWPDLPILDEKIEIW